MPTSQSDTNVMKSLFSYNFYYPFFFPAHLIDCMKLQTARGWAGREEEEGEEEGGSRLRGGGCVGGGDRQDLIKDCLCYVISSKRRRPRCCRDGEQLAWGCLIACSDSFQASSFGAHTRNGTDVYCWAPRRWLHGNHCFYCCDPVTPHALSLSLSRHLPGPPVYPYCLNGLSCYSTGECLFIGRTLTGPRVHPWISVFSFKIDKLFIRYYYSPLFWNLFKLVTQFLILILTSSVIDSWSRLKRRG